MLLVAAIVALSVAFVTIREAVMTLFLALFSALVLEPVVRLMQRHSRFGRGACATILILSLTALAALFALLLLIPLADEFRDFVQALPGMIDDISNNSSVGSWLNYGLGSLNRNLPGYVVMLDPRGGPISGAANWSSGSRRTN